MVCLEIEMAVIGTINELLIQGAAKNAKVIDNRSLLIDDALVFEYSRMMEARSGYAVVNRFSGDSLNRFFSTCSRLFQFDPYQSAQRGRKLYRLRTEDLLPALEFPKEDLCHLKRTQINTLIGHMMDILDPSMNYPVDFLEDMQLIAALEGSGEDAV